MFSHVPVNIPEKKILNLHFLGVLRFLVTRHFSETCSNRLQTSKVWRSNMSPWHKIITCFSVTCPRLDKNDGRSLWPRCLRFLSLVIFMWDPWAQVLAMPCWWGLTRPKQLSMAANAWTHNFFFLVDLGVMLAINVAILPYLVAIVYPSTSVRYSDFLTFSHIPQALHSYNNSECVL